MYCAYESLGEISDLDSLKEKTLHCIEAEDGALILSDVSDVYLVCPKIKNEPNKLILLRIDSYLFRDIYLQAFNMGYISKELGERVFLIIEIKDNGFIEFTVKLKGTYVLKLSRKLALDLLKIL